MDTIKDRLLQLCVRSGKDYRALARQRRAPAGLASSPDASDAGSPPGAQQQTDGPAPDAAAAASSSSSSAGSSDAGSRPSSADAKVQAADFGLSARPGEALPGELFVGVFSEGELVSAWVHMVSSEEMSTGREDVPTAFGRSLWVSRFAEAPAAARRRKPQRAAYFTFTMLCGPEGCRKATDEGGALAAPDYLALARRYQRIYIEGVPTFLPKQRDEARRFVTMIDVFYEAGTRVFAAAEMPGDQLFYKLLHAVAQHGVDPNLGRATRLPKHVFQVRGGIGQLLSVAVKCTCAAPFHLI